MNQFIIDYPQSPTGKAYIGIAKEPLMGNPSGYGFQGVLLQTPDRKLIQCSNCGEWKQRIDTLHIKKCSGGEINNVGEYKQVYGLNKRQGLVSDFLADALRAAGMKNLKRGEPWKYTKGVSRKAFSTRQTENQYGTCPEQLKTQTIDFVKTNKEMPSSSNRGRQLTKRLRYKFGSLNAAFSLFNLPTFERLGFITEYTFPDKSKAKFLLTDIHYKEALWSLIENKCLTNKP